MDVTIDRLKSELSALPSDQRAEIAEFLLGSLDEGEDDPGVEDAGDEEAARRVEAMLRDDPVCIPADTLFAAIRVKFA